MLSIRFSLLPGRVELTCSPDAIRPLSSLRVRFVSAASAGPQAFDAGIDDFLVNLYELMSWPAAGGDVDWQPELLELAESNNSDAQLVAARLAAPEVPRRNPPRSAEPGTPP